MPLAFADFRISAGDFPIVTASHSLSSEKTGRSPCLKGTVGGSFFDFRDCKWTVRSSSTRVMVYTSHWPLWESACPPRRSQRP